MFIHMFINSSLIGCIKQRDVQNKNSVHNELIVQNTVIDKILVAVSFSGSRGSSLVPGSFNFFEVSSHFSLCILVSASITP